MHAACRQLTLKRALKDSFSATILYTECDPNFTELAQDLDDDVYLVFSERQYLFICLILRGCSCV